MKEFANHIVLCNGANAGSIDENDKPLVLEYHDGCNNKNVTINLNKFTSKVYHLKDRLKDLLEIAGYVFAADRKTYRGDKYDLEYHSWSRAFQFHIKVRDLQFWQRAEVKSLLEEVLLFVTGDHKYEFTFYKGADDFPINIFDNEKFTIERPEDLKVVLFSGGLDSVAGTVDLLETTKSELCLVSHQSGQTGVKRTHQTMFEAIDNEYAKRCKHYKFHCGFDHCDSVDETQRTRSFLYTATAFAIAKTYGQNCIYVFENGVISLNFSETQDLMNGRSSRTTHPKTMGLLENLFSKIGETEFRIYNPFLFKTKTDVVNVIKNYNKLSMIQKSVSCSATRNHPAKVPHCGVCSQCIDRRFAIYASEVEGEEKEEFYAFNFLTDDLEKDDVKKSLNEYIRLAQLFSSNNINSFFIQKGPELIEIDEYLEGENEETRMGKVFDLCKRHSVQIEAAINRMRKLYDSPYHKNRPKSFFSLILGEKEYQKGTETLKEIPSRGLKKLTKETCEKLIREKLISDVLIETKTNKIISSMVVKELKRNNYEVTKRNENTISEYFRKLELQIKKEKEGKLIVMMNSRSK